MPCDKIGVKVRKKYVFDFEAVLGRISDVLVRVALRVNDGGRARHLVSDQVGSVGQARQIELFENQLGSSPVAPSYLG
jgi:hypothetical protein